MLRNFRRVFKDNQTPMIIVMVVILFGLLAYLSPNLRKSVAGDENDASVIARVYGRDILNQDVNYKMSSTLRRLGSQNNTSDLLPLLKTQTVNSLVYSRLIEELAERCGVIVTDTELREQLEHFLIERGFVDADNKLLPSKKINDILLRRSGLSLKQLEKEIKLQLVNKELFQQAAMQVPIDSEWINLENSIHHTKLSFDSVTLTPDLTAIAEPDAMTLAAFFKESGARFQIGPRRIIDYVILTPETMKLASVDDEALRNAYNINKNQFAELHLSHILLKVSNSTEEQNVIKKANELRSKLLSGADFKVIARSFSQDIETKSKQGDLGWFTFSKMRKEFEEPLKNLQVGAVTEPICTSMGVHLVRLDDRKDKDFNQIKEGLRAKLNFEKFNIKAKDQLEQLRNHLVKRQLLATEAKKLNLQCQTSQPLLRDQICHLDDVIDSNDILNETFKLKVGDVSKVIPVNNGNGFVLFTVREERPFGTPNLSEVKDQVVNAWKLETARKVLTNKVAKLVETNNLKLIGNTTSYQSVTIAGELGELRNHPGICQALLNAAVGSLTPIFWTPDGKLWIAKINARVLADQPTFAVRKELVDTLQTRLASQMLANELHHLEQNGNQRSGLTSLYGRFNGIWRSTE